MAQKIQADSSSTDGVCDFENVTQWPHYADDEIAAALEVLRSGKVNFWTGENVRRFEAQFAKMCSRRYALAVNSGSVALELALEAAGIGPGDDVIVTPRSFIASASSVLRVGATPVFADVCKDSQNLSPETVADAITPKTKAVLAVHLAGWPCDMDGIGAVCKRENIQLIEDSSQAHGARYNNKPVGSFGAASVFSFCQDKIISTAGEGGIVLTDNKSIYKRIYALRDSGRSPVEETSQTHTAGQFSYERSSIGSNFRMTELQAALGRVQLTKLDKWVQTRQGNAHILNEALGSLRAVRTTVPPEHISHAYYMYFFFLRLDELAPEWTWERVLEAIRAKGVPCRQGICPEIYLEKGMSTGSGEIQTRLANAVTLGATGLALPVHPGWDEHSIRIMANAVANVILLASKS